MAKNKATKNIEEIFKTYQKSLNAFIHSRVAMPIVAEDIAQEVWYQFSRQKHIDSIKNIRAWLFQVARNKIIDHYRKKAPEWLEDYLVVEEDYNNERLITDFYTPEDSYWAEEFWEAFYEALEALPENQRIVFVQNELESITLRAIAEKSGDNLKTIISRKHYAVKRLRELLEVWYDDLLEEN